MTRRLMILFACALGAALAGASAADGATLRYQKRGDPINGRTRGECGYQCYTSWYRAGSGNGGTDSCQYGNWIPNGAYTVIFHDDFYNFDIKGRVWYLNDYYCGGGRWATQLFAHSEETARQGQTCLRGYDERYCWDGDDPTTTRSAVSRLRRGRSGADGYSGISGRIDNFHHAYDVSRSWSRVGEQPGDGSADNGAAAGRAPPLRFRGVCRRRPRHRRRGRVPAYDDGSARCGRRGREGAEAGVRLNHGGRRQRTGQ